MATRRREDERFAYFAEAAIVLLDLPDAVFRGYEGDDQLLGAPRPNDHAPGPQILRREIARLEPQKVYFPLGIGGHVDHRLVPQRRPGAAARSHPRWVMPGPGLGGHRLVLRGLPVRLVDRVQRLADLGEDAFAGLPPDPPSAGLSPTSATSSSARSAASRSTRASWSGSSADDQPMADAVRAYGHAWPTWAALPAPPSATGPPAEPDA